MKSLAAALVLALPSVALAQSFEVAEAQITGGVENKQPSNDKSTFNTGERAYVWMKLIPQEDAELKIRWSADDKPIWTMEAVPVRTGRVWYYKTLDVPGNWKAELMNGADEVLKELTFSVSGEPTGRGIPTTDSDAESGTTDAAAITESTHLEVVEFKLSEEIKDRNPVNPATTFTAGTKVYGWLKLNVKEAETQLKLRWKKDGTVRYTSEAVTVKQSPGWRTWRSKTVKDGGAWSVEILDAEDKVIHVQEFSVN